MLTQRASDDEYIGFGGDFDERSEQDAVFVLARPAGRCEDIHAKAMFRDLCDRLSDAAKADQAKSFA